MREETKREIIEEIKRIYRKKKGISEGEVRVIMSKEIEELEIILTDGFSHSLIALKEAGFKENDFSMMLFRWLLSILLDILCPEWDEEDREELIEAI